MSADQYRDVTANTTTPIHTGEQIYLRENFKELIETKAVNVLGPVCGTALPHLLALSPERAVDGVGQDPMDVGGLMEMKWICEHADLHGLQVPTSCSASAALPWRPT